MSRIDSSSPSSILSQIQNAQPSVASAAKNKTAQAAAIDVLGAAASEFEAKTVKYKNEGIFGRQPTGKYAALSTGLAKLASGPGIQSLPAALKIVSQDPQKFFGDGSPNFLNPAGDKQGPVVGTLSKLVSGVGVADGDAQFASAIKNIHF